MHPGTYKVPGILGETTWVGARLRAQSHRQPTFPTALLRMIQTEFNESFCQALEHHQRVRWLEFDQLRSSLDTVNFRP